MDRSRRDFVLGIARGAVYAAPLVLTLAAPDALLAQGQSGNSQKGGMGMGMQMQMMQMASVAPGFNVGPEAAYPDAPWSAPPPSGGMGGSR